MGHELSDYIYEVPATVPDGKILVHNQVPPRLELGAGGFRAWIVDPDPTTYEECKCGWAGWCGPHYRVVATWKGKRR